MKVKQKLVGSGRARMDSGDSVDSNSFLSPSTPSPGPIDVSGIKQEELTEEDEVRRQRRRERNKIAATKCRNKKKHRTMLLIKVLYKKIFYTKLA